MLPGVTLNMTETVSPLMLSSYFDFLMASIAYSMAEEGASKGDSAQKCRTPTSSLAPTSSVAAKKKHTNSSTSAKSLETGKASGVYFVGSFMHELKDQIRYICSMLPTCTPS